MRRRRLCRRRGRRRRPGSFGLHPQAIPHVHRLHIFDHPRQHGRLVDGFVAIDDELGRCCRRQLSRVESRQHSALVFYAERKVGEGDAKRLFEAHPRATAARKFGRLLHEVPRFALGPGLLKLDTEPRREKGKRIARCHVGIKVVMKVVEQADDGVEKSLKGGDKPHAEVALLIDRRQPATQITALGRSPGSRPVELNNPPLRSIGVSHVSPQMETSH